MLYCNLIISIGGGAMPVVKEKGRNVSLNDPIAEYMKADQEFMDGIRKGVTFRTLLSKMLKGMLGKMLMGMPPF